MDLSTDPLAERLGRAVVSALSHRSGGGGAPGAEETWACLRDIDAPAFEAPIGVGGYDLGLAGGVEVAAGLGRRAAPDVYSGGALAVDALSAHGERPERTAELAGGPAPVRLTGFDALAAGRLRTRLEPDGDGWRLAGAIVRDRDVTDDTLWCLPFDDGERIGLALVADKRLPAPERPGGGDLAAQVDRIELDGHRIEAADVIGHLGTGRPLSDPDAVLGRSRVRQAAYLYGLARRAHELTVEHANARRQFGKSLMEFQAVSFPLARLGVSLSAVRLSLARAAWLADHGRPFALAAVETLALAAETALATVRDAVQFHGARGMSTLAPVHGYYLAAWREATRMGSVESLWREAGTLRLRGDVPDG